MAITVGNQTIPSFKPEDFRYTPYAAGGNTDSGSMIPSTPASWNLNNVGNYFPGSGWSNLSPTNWNFNYGGSDWGDQSRTNNLLFKSGDTTGTVIPFTFGDGMWNPGQPTRQITWDTNAGNRFQNQALLGMAGLAAGANYLPSLLGGAGAEGAAAGAVAEASPIAMPGAAVTSSLPALGGASGAAAGSAAGASGMNFLSSALGNGGWISPVLQFGGALLGADSARDAQRSQQAASEAAIAEQRRQYDTTRSDFAPWREAGLSGLNQLTALLSPGGELNRNYTWADIENDPIFGASYRTGLETGANQLMRSAAGPGGTGRDSGATLKALTRFGQDYANSQAGNALNRILTQQGNQYNRLAGLSGVGQTATTQVANAGQNTANNVADINIGMSNARGASQIAQGNIWSQLLGGLGNWYQENQLIRALGGR